MTNHFSDILSSHLTRYPLMQPQDAVKLSFQSEFGPEHLVTDKNAMEKYILSEWKSISPDTPCREPEDIGSGLVRFHLTQEFKPDAAAPLLAKLFCLTAKNHTGTKTGLEEKLNISEEYFLSKSEEKFLSGIKDYFMQYRTMGCPAVHHSQIFRETYRPHYRLLSKPLACYFSLLLDIASLGGGIIAIDGNCGSGKTQLSEIIAAVLDCNVFHTDDFYLPLSQRQENWKTIPGGNMDLHRLKEEVLEPLHRGAWVKTRRYSCQTKSYSEEIPYQPKALTIIEGSYSHHPELTAFYDKKIFLTCDKDIQHRRLRDREGDYVSMFHTLWIPMEERYHRAYPITEDTIIVNTNNYFL